MHKHLQLRPQLTGYVEADLPKDAFVDSTMTAEDIKERANTPSSASSDGKHSGKRSKRNQDSDVASAIREFTYSSIQAEIAKQKIHYMEKEDKRMENEEARKEREEARKEREEARKEREEARKEKEEARLQKEEFRKEKEEATKESQHFLEQWNQIQSSIRVLRSELRQETDKDTRAELKHDIEGMIKRKNEVARHLGFD